MLVGISFAGADRIIDRGHAGPDREACLKDTLLALLAELFLVGSEAHENLVGFITESVTVLFYIFIAALHGGVYGDMTLLQLFYERFAAFLSVSGDRKQQGRQ